MKNYKIFASFLRGTLNVPKIELVENDYNAVELQFEFLDENDDSTKVLEIKKPNGNSFIAEIKDNKVVLVDHDEKGNLIPVISQKGTYTFEVTKYTSDSKLTISQTGQLVARDEVVKVNDPQIEEDVRIPLLDTLIMETTQAKAYATEQGDYAKQQGDYAKEQVSNVINANKEASNIITNFENNVDKYTNDFNSNAKNKKTEYNTNATEKLEVYNTNAAAKLKEYNDNATSKTTDFNKNVENQTNTFNENSANKLKAYDTNAETKQSEYDKNAVAKQSEYNTNAQNKLNEFNANADSYNNRITVNENNIVDINSSLDVIVPKNNASGVPLYVDDALPYKVFNYGAKGKFKQETTTGKNKFETGNLVESTIYGITFTPVYNENNLLEYINVNGTATGNAYYNFPKKSTLSAGNYILSGCPSGGNASSTYALSLGDIRDYGNKKNFTLEEETTLNTSYIVVFKGYVANNIKFYPMVRLSSETDDTFEPYSGGTASPNPDYSSKVEVIEGDVSYRSVGKNLFNPAKLTQEKDYNTYDSVTGLWTTNSNSGYSRSLFYNAVGGSRDRDITKLIKLGIGTYTIKFYDFTNNTDDTRPLEFGLFDNTGILIENVTKGSDVTTFTTTSECYLDIRRYRSTGTISFSKVQLESGSSVTNLEPHQETITPIDLKGNFVGKLPNGVADRFLYKDRHIYLEKNVGKVVLDGSDDERWTYYSANDEWARPYVLINDKKIAQSLYDYDTLSNKFISSNWMSCYLGNFNKYAVFSYNADKRICFLIKKEDLISLDTAGVKDYFSKNQTEAYYPLESPELIDLGEYDLSTLQGTNNISLLANIEPSEMNITYALDLKKYTDKKIASLSSQIL